MRYSHVPFVTDLVRLPNGVIGDIISIEEGFDDCVNIRLPDGKVTRREPEQLESVDVTEEQQQD